MKKYLIILFSMAFLSLGFSSCETTYTGIDSNQEALLDNIDINLIVRNGTPYYYNGFLNYYYYGGLYYYPIYYNNYWYFRAYHRPFRRGYFPACHNWRPRPHWRGYRGFGRPDRYGRVYRPNSNHRPNVRPNNGSRRFGNGSTNIVPRSSTRTPSTRSRSIGTNRSFGTFSRPSGSSFGRSSGTFSRPSRGSFGGNRNIGGSRPSGGSFGGHR